MFGRHKKSYISGSKCLELGKCKGVRAEDTNCLSHTARNQTVEQVTKGEDNHTHIPISSLGIQTKQSPGGIRIEVNLTLRTG